MHEYKVVRKRSNRIITMHGFQDQLNEIAHDGWRLVAADDQFFYFERER